MSGSIGSIGGSTAMMMHGMRGMHRPDPSQLAEKLYSQLDTSGQGYIQKSDLQTAVDKISTSGNTSSSGSVDDLFARLDTDSDGKVTKQEFSDIVRQVAEQLDNQFMRMRMKGSGEDAGMGATGGIPPPPPPQGGDDAGFTKEELTSQLSEIGEADSKRASLISSIVDNFDQADSDGDGKVSFKEAMAYDQAGSSTTPSASSAATTGSDSASTSAASDNLGTQLLLQIMRLAHAYGIGGGADSTSPSLIATSA
jgi:Ca2+-binding EF-hand superfamily protein